MSDLSSDLRHSVYLLPLTACSIWKDKHIMLKLFSLKEKALVDKFWGACRLFSFIIFCLVSCKLLHTACYEKFSPKLTTIIELNYSFYTLDSEFVLPRYSSLCLLLLFIGKTTACGEKKTFSAWIPCILGYSSDIQSMSHDVQPFYYNQ